MDDRGDRDRTWAAEPLLEVGPPGTQARRCVMLDLRQVELQQTDHIARRPCSLSTDRFSA